MLTRISLPHVIIIIDRHLRWHRHMNCIKYGTFCINLRFNSPTLNFRFLNKSRVSCVTLLYQTFTCLLSWRWFGAWAFLFTRWFSYGINAVISRQCKIHSRAHLLTANGNMTLSKFFLSSFLTTLKCVNVSNKME